MSTHNFVDEAISRFKESEPEMFRIFFRKRIDFHHPEYMPISHMQLSLMIYGSLVEQPKNDVDLTWSVTAALMDRHNFPIYHLSQAFCEMVNATNPPLDVPMSELNVPFPSSAFFVPSKFSKAAFGTTTGYVCITRVKNGEDITIQSGNVIANHGDKTCFLSASESTPKGLPVHYSLIGKTSHTLGQMLDPAYGDMFKIEDIPESINIEVTPDEEKMIPQRVGAFGFKLLAILNAAKEVMPDQPNSGKRTKKDSHVSYYPPIWVGGSYRIAAGDGLSHASPATHWRRGHVRRQHYGPGLESTMLIWIKPVLVNKPKETT